MANLQATAVTGNLSATNITGGIIGTGVDFPQGCVIQTKSHSTTAVINTGASSNQDLIVNSTASLTARQTNSLYRIGMFTTHISFAVNSNPDVHDVGLRVRWGTSSGTVSNNNFGPSTNHRHAGGSHMATSTNFYSVDGHTANGFYGIWGSSSCFSASWEEVCTVPAGNGFFFRCDVYTGSGAVYWNRHDASNSSNLGFTVWHVQEIAV